jgi:hypothetical protein
MGRCRVDCARPRALSFPPPAAGVGVWRCGRVGASAVAEQVLSWRAQARSGLRERKRVQARALKICISPLCRCASALTLSRPPRYALCSHSPKTDPIHSTTQREKSHCIPGRIPVPVTCASCRLRSLRQRYIFLVLVHDQPEACEALRPPPLSTLRRDCGLQVHAWQTGSRHVGVPRCGSPARGRAQPGAAPGESD